jgi:hypothetical protein
MLIRAAVRGAIDFKRAKVLDPKWWRLVTLVVDGLARDDDVRLADAGFRYHLALLSNGELTPESFKDVQKHAREAYQSLVVKLKPWLADAIGGTLANEAAHLSELYKQHIGDMNNPEFRAMIEAEAARMHAETRQGSYVDDNRALKSQQSKAPVRKKSVPFN